MGVRVCICVGDTHRYKTHCHPQHEKLASNATHNTIMPVFSSQHPILHSAHLMRTVAIRLYLVKIV
jgi:hypothetical protein